jgi:TRAP-type C4-dicarboxylate transport system permease small subunit
MDWMEIVSALALVMFIVIMFPAARYMIKNSPKGTTSDWLSFIVPLVAVVLFIILLVKLI